MEKSFYKRSWNALKTSPHCFRTLLLLTLVSLIPIFGPIACYGFIYRWAREGAWGLETPLPNRVGDTNGLLKIGVIVFVIMLCWNLALTLVSTGLSQIPAIGAGLSLICAVATIFITVFLQIIAMRAVIYNSFEPAIQIGQAWDMLKRDPKGLLPVLIVTLVFSAIVVVLTFIITFTISLIAFIPAMTTGNGVSDIVPLLFACAPLIIFAIVVFIVIVGFLSMLANVLIVRIMGYWMAQFQPAMWGPSSDYLPAGVGPAPRV